ncbi:MAG: InlB B-repeat-containing protein [Bacilli bacterium]|nr:InlB B-repeat-containing protein [Bacilli bacterium]
MKKIALMIIPLTVTSFLTNCGPKQCTVTFDSDNGTPVASQTVYPGETIYEPTKPTKASSEEFNFQFEEWQLNGKEYNFNTPVTSDFTLKAKWKETKKKYVVTFDSNGGDQFIDPQFIEPGDSAYAEYPGDIHHPDTSTNFYTFAGWHEVIDGEMDPIAFVFTERLIEHDTLLRANWKIDPRHYLVDAYDTTNLEFLTNDNHSSVHCTVTAGQPFTFKVKTNSPDYIVPSSLQISVDGKPRLMDGYTVDIDEQDPTQATVTIAGEKVVGHIEITGEGVRKGKFTYEAPYTYGLETIPSGTHELEGEGDLKIVLHPIDGAMLPKGENIYIQFDNCEGEEKVQWITPSEDESYVHEYCDYDKDSGELTIKAKHIKNGIKIIARANNYELLKKLDWNTINEISYLHLAPYLFYIGETKTVKVNGLDHQVRIIDFTHDCDEDDNLVGITFEFVNLVSYDNGNPQTIPWEDKAGTASTNRNFPHSSLNYFLNYDADSILFKLDSDLRGVIKTVNKHVGVGANYSAKLPYTTKLFPLSFSEICANQTEKDPVPRDEGTLYAYYNHPEETVQEANERRIKKDINGNPNNYWLRSPVTLLWHHAWYNTDRGELHAYAYIFHAHDAVAPAFCV